jgi:hypothetical protein
MNFGQLYMNYQFPVEVIYSILVSSVTLFIFLKVKKLYSLSSHPGIRLFGLSFLFLMLAFVIYLASTFLFHYGQPMLINSILSILFAYFISVSGIYLVYCQVWKQAEGFSRNIIRLRMLVLHLAALTVAILDFLFSEGWLSFLFLSQMFVLLFGVVISYHKYQEARAQKKQSFLQLYFIALVLMFIAWALNYIGEIFIGDSLIFYVRIITVFILLIFAYGVIRFTKRA